MNEFEPSNEGEKDEVKPEKVITWFTCGPRCISGEHKWDGPEVRLDHGGSASCSKCGKLAIDEAMWY